MRNLVFLVSVVTIFATIVGCGNKAESTEEDSLECYDDSSLVLSQQDINDSIDFIAAQLDSSNFVIKQYDQNRLIYTKKGTSDNPTAAHIYIRNISPSSMQILSVSSNDQAIAFIQGEQPDIVYLFSKGGKGGYSYVTKIDLQQQNEIFWQEIEDVSNYSNITPVAGGFKGLSSRKSVMLRDSIPVEYEERCEVTINYSGEVVARTKSDTIIIK